MINLIAAYYWDPNPVAFTIPYLDHPVRWYGLLFAFGFAVGFLIFIPILRQRLIAYKTFMPRDIADWTNLITQLKIAVKTKSSILSALGNADRDLILATPDNPNPQKQQQIISILTTIIQSPGKNRLQLENAFPNAIHPISRIAYSYTDRLLWYMIIGTVIGARLGHIIFYEWPRYSANPIEIFKIWEGGLASHGGTLGILIALYFFIRSSKNSFPEMSFLNLCDLLTIPTAFSVAFIRLGNFVNQEILGSPTNQFWGVIFGHPADGSMPIPRHPVQLYEAFAYIALFLLLWTIWKITDGKTPTGLLIGLFFTILFSSRFFLEFFKAPQSMMVDETWLQTGQLLSLPFVGLGCGLILYSMKYRRRLLGISTCGE